MTAPIPPDLERRLEMIAERVLQRYVSSGPLRNASSGPLSIREGQVSLNYPDELGGSSAVYFGPLYSGGAYVGTGLLIQAPDGTDIASFSYNPDTGWQTANLHDAQNNVVVGNDRVSGQGLAYPLIPASFYRTRYGDFDVATTSPTFETLWDTVVHHQQPRLLVAVRASMDTAGATGELRVLVNGDQLGDVAAQSFSVVTNTFGPAPVAGDHMSSMTVEVQGRRTSTTGTMKVEPLYMTGFPS